MTKLRLFLFLATLILGSLAVCWSGPQGASQRLAVKDQRGVEIHTLMSDQYNMLIDYLEATRQTNALEMFRQYRCSYNADTAVSGLRETVAALRELRGGHSTQAIQLLEQQLNRHAYFMCNSYGCLNTTNRERVKVDSVEQALDYYAMYPSPALGAELEKGMKTVLRLSRGKPGQ